MSNAPGTAMPSQVPSTQPVSVTRAVLPRTSPAGAGPHWVELARLDGEAAVRAGLRRVSAWLFAVAALVVVIIGVGGATRLTGSGLSITEWGPLIGAIPPLSDADWRTAFEKYQQIPQYALLNKGMSLDAFKTIFWWEWGHRQLGRLIGLAYVLPLLGFLGVGAIPRRTILPLLAIGPLIGLQGAVGWFMVKSGFEPNQVAVSPYRLTLHLSLAFAVLGMLLWYALRVRRASSRHVPTASHPVWATRIAAVLVAGLYLQIVLGGFVAGTRAGLTYNTWPLMDGRLIPAGLAMLQPWYLNLTENITTVQFNHRMLAYLVAALALGHALGIWLSSRCATIRTTATALGLGVIAQGGLGIATLLNATQGKIPLHLGVAHQVGAALLFALAIWHLSRMMDQPSSLAAR